MLGFDSHFLYQVRREVRFKPVCCGISFFFGGWLYAGTTQAPPQKSKICNGCQLTCCCWRGGVFGV